MNIACDARALVGSHTGVGTWTTQVMAGLASDPSTHILLGASKTLDLPEALHLPNVSVLPRQRFPLPGSLWLHLALPTALQRGRADVFIGSLAILPRRSAVPGIAMVHDLTPRTHPERHTLKTRITFNPFIKASLEGARAVVVGSEATRAEVVEHFPEVRDRLHLIGYGVDQFFSPSDDPDEGEQTRGLFADGRPYILHLGTLEPRKGLLTLVEAWDRLHEIMPDAPSLVLAGGEGWEIGPLIERIDRSPNIARIHRPGYVTPDQARALMRHAEAFVLASEAEGFGLPLAEAIACGAPCIASDIPALRESGVGAALFTPVGDSEALAHVIARTLDPETATSMRQASAARGSSLSWEPIIDQWRELIQSVVG
ncbi:MAG: glycosyltransferase family 4 protein [Acidobacteria bacterium]|nr:glycosyltransferase family 4 protein [Acidobacteriota bacterium]